MNVIKEAENRIEQNKIDSALDMIMEHINTLALIGQFDKIDEILATTDVKITSPGLVLCLLAITLSMKSKLKYREDFYNDTAEILDEETLKGLQ
jgi:hypothetical protein